MSAAVLNRASSSLPTARQRVPGTSNRGNAQRRSELDGFLESSDDDELITEDDDDDWSLNIRPARLRRDMPGSFFTPTPSPEAVPNPQSPLRVPTPDLRRDTTPLPEPAIRLRLSRPRPRQPIVPVQQHEDGVIEIMDSDSDIEFVGFGHTGPPRMTSARPPRPPVPPPRLHRASRAGPGFIDLRNSPAHSPARQGPENFERMFIEEDDFVWNNPRASLPRNADAPAARAPNRNARGEPSPRRDRIFSPPPPPHVVHPIPPMPPLDNIRQAAQRAAQAAQAGGWLALPGVRGIHQFLVGNDDAPPAPAPAPAPAPPHREHRGLGRRAGLHMGLGGALLRGGFAQFMQFAGGVDRDGWQQYNPAMFGEYNPPAHPLNPREEYKREWVFPRPTRGSETNDVEAPEPPMKPVVIDLTSSDRKGKRKAVEIESDHEDGAQKMPRRMLVCVGCAEPLVGESGRRDDGDKVYALRCGHVIDGRCMHKFSEDPEVVANFPFVEVDTAAAQTRGAPTFPPKRRRKAAGGGRRRKNAKQVQLEEETLVLAEREWTCPAKHCARVHRSQYIQKIIDGVSQQPRWTAKGNEGPIAMFV
ncbi:hypothetical protein BKA62DRAFT_666976 [Auriculariales sp. MPI-PUGE-AT-0066]|nr:hypothetical protein BKA62DRAFT_666976 [Auriculariales sp. MPI-PUGE-AT-0066]